MGVMALGALLIPLTGLIIWGPPSLRLTGRELTAALEQPFQLDSAAAFQGGTWALATVVVILLVIREIGMGTDLVPSVVKHGPVRWYLAYGVLGIASSVYSPSPLYTIYFALQIIVGVLAVVLLLHRAGPDRVDLALKISYAVFVLQMLAILALYTVDPFLVGEIPQGEIGYRLNGGILRDYGVSALYAGLLFLSLARSCPRRWQRALSLLAYLATWGVLAAARTRSTTITAILIAIVMFATHPSRRVKIFAALAGAVVTGLAAIAGIYGPLLELLSRSGSGITTLSGRTTAFSFLIEQWRQSPIWGLGYAAGARTSLVDFVADTRLHIGAAHDVISKVLIDLGLIGAVVLAIAFIYAWREVIGAWRRWNRDGQRFLVVLQLTCLMISVTIKSSFGGSLAGTDMPFVVAIVTLWALRRAENKTTPLPPASTAPPQELPTVLVRNG